LIQLGVTTGAFAALAAAMFLSLDVSYWLTLGLAFPTAGFMIRLFIIQHDCGHGSYFRTRRARDFVGACIGVLTLIPYQYWRRTHAYHHAHNGDLDFRGFGDVDTITVAEYHALSPRKRLGYRLYRHPLILLGLGPFFQFVVKHRYPTDLPRDWKHAWASVWRTNAAIAVALAVIATTIGLQRFLLVYLPVLAITTTVGVYLFYVQHQFEDTYWHRHDHWNYFEASLEGSSLLVLPRWLEWLTGYIGIHHVHHLNARIPNYKLRECMEAVPELQNATRLRLRDGWRLLWLTLWDEESQQLIGFKDLKRRAAAPARLDRAA